MHISLEMCVHPPDDDCAGSELIAMFMSLLPPSVQRLCFKVVAPMWPDDAHFLIRSVPDWTDIVLTFRHDGLQTLELAVPTWYVKYGDPAFDTEFIEWEDELRLDLHPIEREFPH